MGVQINRRAVSLTGRGARGESFTAAARRVGALGSVPVDPDATDAEVLAAATGSELQNSDLFEPRPTVNLANPDADDPALADTAAQLHRVWQGSGAGGALSAVDHTALRVYGVVKRIDVSSIAVGDPIFVQANGAPVGMKFHFTDPSAFLGFYDAGHVFEAALASGDIDRESGDRAFTIPDGRVTADYVYVAFNVADTTGTMTEARLRAFEEAIVVNGGSDYAEFTPYAEPGEYDLTTVGVQAALLTVGKVTVAVQAGMLFVRTAAQSSPAYDFCEMIDCAEVADDYELRTGVVDFVGLRAIPKDTSPNGTIAAFNQADILRQGGDESAPIHLNGKYLGAGHRVPGWETVIASHGLTNANIGAVASDGAGKKFVVVALPDANTVSWLPDNTGTADKWEVTGAITGSTLTWFSGGADFGALSVTGTPEQVQIPPVIRNYEREVLLDGAEIDTSANAVLSGDDFRIAESYGVSNVGSILTYLKGRVGSGDPPDWDDDDIDVQVELSHTYVWDRYGARVKYATHHVLQAYRRDAWGQPGDYFGEVQCQPPARTGDAPPGIATAIDLYIPDLSGPVSGYDFTARADVTANASWITVPKSAAEDPADPPSHVAYIARDGSGDRHGFVMGAVRDVGLGKPATRAASVNNLFGLSSAEKGYLDLADNALGDAAAGDVFTSATYVAPFLCEDDELTIPAVLVPNSSGGHECLIAAHETLSRKWARLPADTVGRMVTTRKADADVTVHSEVATRNGVMISVANGQGDVVLTLAPGR